MPDMYEFYNSSTDFKNYVNKYMQKHGIIDIYSALKSEMIRQVYSYYKSENRK